MSVFGIIVIAIGIIVVIIGLFLEDFGRILTIGIGVVVAIVGAVLMWASTQYNLEPGEAAVLKSWGGVVNQEVVTETGWHTKGLFEDAIEFDTKNALLSYISDGTKQYGGAPTTGPQITFTDKDKITANMDIVLQYSIDPSILPALVEDYGTQQDFNAKVVEIDARSVPRDVPGKFTSAEVMTDRPRLASEITTQLEEAWENKGIIVEDVSLQEIRYPDSVKQRFEDAQNAATEVIKAQAEADKQKIQAEGDATAQIARANGEAEANRILAASLTPEIIKLREIEMLANAQKIVVPNDFSALGNIQ